MEKDKTRPVFLPIFKNQLKMVKYFVLMNYKATRQKKIEVMPQDIGIGRIYLNKTSKAQVSTRTRHM